MRFLTTLVALALILAAVAPAGALTQEEILKRRLEKMQQADPQMRAEEQQRKEQLETAKTQAEVKPPKDEDEKLTISDPVRRPNPEPRGGLWQKGSAATGGSPAASQPSVQPAASSRPVSAQAQTAPVAPRPATDAPQSTPVQAPAQTAMSRTASPVAPGATSQPIPAKAATPNPKTAASLAEMAAKAKAGGDMQTALTMLTEAVTADPTDPDLYNNRGNVLNNLGKTKEALVDYDRAIAMKTSDPAFFSNRGLAHERLGNQERACTDYKRACDLGDCDFYKSYKADGHCR